jgi:sugar phosphate permease
MSSSSNEGRSPGERATLWTLWIAYGAFYFGRANLAAAVPGLEHDLHFSKTQIGLILGSLKFAYGIGQLLNGQLAERVSPRRLLAIGMLGSAALNLVFGVSTGLYFLIFVWAMNGYCQALGWTPVMRVAANWIPAGRRGRAIGFLGTSYQVGAAVTFVVSGWAAEHLGWRGALYLPAGVLIVAAVYMLLTLRDSPTAVATVAASPGPAHVETPRPSVASNLKATLSNPYLWLLALSLAFLNACRFGFLDWGLSYLREVQGTTVDKAALNCAILPIGGIAGALLTGWITDRFLGGRRAPAICLSLTLLGVCTLAYDHVARSSFVGTIILLVVIGFAIFGPQVLLVGTAPADLARRGTAAAAAGFVDFMGYMGAFAGDQVTGWAVDHSKTLGWRVAIWIWAGWAFAAAAMSGVLWIVTERRRRIELPHEV